MNIFNLPRIHIISNKQIEDFCSKLDTMVTIRNILLQQRPKFKKH